MRTLRRALLLLLFLSGAQAEILPVPDAIRDGDVVNLKCGRTYSGELNLANKRGVTVRTEGSCGKAVLTPALPVSGWRRDPRQRERWVAEPGFTPAQLSLDRQFQPRAHHPNRPQTWMRGERRAPNLLRARLPDPDLRGATVVWRANDWLIQARAIADYDGQMLMLAAGDDEGFGLPPETEFYVEGKRWMVDTPGEWAYEDGLLWLWMPDGRSPEGRVWAAPRARAIDASGSQGVHIDGVQIRDATLAIDGSGSRDLRISNTGIDNSVEEAILAGHGSRIERVQVRGSVQNGIRANDDVRGVSVLDSRFDRIGMLGMPRRSKGAIVFEHARDIKVLRNHIADVAYIGIRVFRDALVADNVIERACLRLDDCGGIYTFARDRQPLQVTIARNRVSGLAGRHAHAIYLDDFANGVQVTGNQLVDNPGGMQLHNGFDNLIADNLFSNSRHEHILFNETAAFSSVSNNQVRRNRFVSSGEVPVYRLWSHHGSAHVDRFADFERNVYRSVPRQFAHVEGLGMLSHDDWHARFGRTDGEPASAGRAAPKLARERQQE